VNAETVWETRLHAEVARGGRHLELATTLLQRMRLADATGGTWEAGDLLILMVAALDRRNPAAALASLMPLNAEKSRLT